MRFSPGNGYKKRRSGERFCFCSIRRLAFVIAVYTAGSLYYGYHYISQQGSYRRVIGRYYKNQSCLLHRLDPYDPAILKYVGPTELIKCEWPEPQLTMIGEDNVLRFNHSAMTEAGYTNASLDCHYQSITRPDGKDDVTVYESATLMTGNDIMTKELIFVNCADKRGKTVYTNYHAHLLKKEVHSTQKRNGDTDRPSVLVFFVDSLSHMNVLRYLPKTHRFLTKIMEAEVMNGMTRIGGNTWPNAAAMLTGKRVYSGEIPTFPKGQYYDDYPVIWRNFSTEGHYLTLLAEDFPEYTIFNQLASGFLKQPTDHYLRPFWVAVDVSYMNNHSSSYCLGAVPRHMLQLNYLRQFLLAYRDLPYFAYTVFGEICHGEMRRIGAADDDFANFFEEMYFDGHLDQTFVFFIGDHGHRTDSLARTPLGRMEMNMPISAIILPPSIRNKFPQVVKNLQRNSEQLTSMFDYYETFVDILRYAAHGSTLGEGRTDKLFLSKRISYSLFENIPANRTCANAGIPGSFCTCIVDETDVPISDRRARQAADILLDELNDLIKNHRSICATWIFSEIISSRAINDLNVNSTAVNDDRIVLVMEVKPGGAKFESIVSLNSNMAAKKLSKNAGNEINRVNSYKGEDSCITKEIRQSLNFDIRPYCYCIK